MRRPSSAGSPFTATRPSAISSSDARRLATPAAASTFWSFSVWLLGTQRVLERLHDLGTGHEVAERRQVVERVEAELLQEQQGGAVEDGLAGTGVAGDLLDVPPLLERADDAVDVDASDGGQLGPGDRLLVGDD